MSLTAETVLNIFPGIDEADVTAEDRNLRRISLPYWRILDQSGGQVPWILG